MTPSPSPEDPGSLPPPAPGPDPVFRRLISLASGLALGGMLASLAAIELGDHGKLEFRWHWAILPLVGAGLALGFWFWNVLWQAQSSGAPAAKKRLRNVSILLGIVALTSFWYPMKFVQAERRQDVLIGLGMAFLVLSVFGWLIYKTIRLVSENEPRDGEVDPPEK